MESSNDFGFGFNNANYSDRILVIELLPDPVEQDSHGGTSYYTRRNSSRTETKTVHINTLILAAKSPFFYKLFSNGMAESNQRRVTLHIQESEEAAFMDCLKFMYTNTLSSTTRSALLSVLMAADKFEVVSCIKYCIQSLQKLQMTRESAMLYLDLPSTILKEPTMQPLIEAAYVRKLFPGGLSQKPRRNNPYISLLPNRTAIHSQPFELSGHVFDLMTTGYDYHRASFALYINLIKKNEGALKVENEFALRKKPTEVFASVGYKIVSNFDEGTCWGYFINGVLHIRARLSMKK